jgi:DNA-binding CsgD family transcriptional regulator
MLTGLIGRRREADVFESLLLSVRSAVGERPDGHGGSLVVSGPAGIGKSALLHNVGELAARSGFRVARLDGVQSEVAFPFAGIHRLTSALTAGLPPAQERQAELVRSAVGVPDGEGPSVARVGMAVLDILTAAADDAPLLVVADDAQWLDQATWDCLSFVGRRLAFDPVVLIMSVRTGADILSRAIPPGLSTLEVEPLDEPSAGLLLTQTAPQLAPAVRDRVLAEARGNPLALIELPKELDGAAPAALLPGLLPLSTRLEQAFAGRLDGLPTSTQELLLVAAAHDEDSLEEILLATSSMTSREVSAEDVAAAADVGLVAVEQGRLRFSHPLMRSAVYQRAGLAQRHAAHRSLARLLADVPDRAVWHRAAATTGADDDLADDLTRIARHMRRSGDATAALTTLERALALSDDASTQAGLRLQAAELALELGRADDARRMLPDTGSDLVDDVQRNRLAVMRELVSSSRWSGTERIRGFVDLARTLHSAGADDEAFEALEYLSFRMWWSNPDRETRELVLSVADDLARSDDNAGPMMVLALCAPLERGAAVLEWAESVRAQIDEGTADQQLNFGLTTCAVGAYDLAVGPLLAASDWFRERGRLAALASTLVSATWADINLGLLPRALVTAGEAQDRAAESGQPLWLASAQLGSAVIAAHRGDADTGTGLIEAAERTFLEWGSHSMLAMAQQARTAIALRDERYSEAFDEVRRVFDRDDIAYHRYFRLQLVADLVESGVHSGRTPEVTALLQPLDALGERSTSPMLRANLAYARALLADDAHAEAAFEAALAGPLTNWPLLHARCRLEFGSWLRRRRSISAARAQLRSAHSTFAALGTVAWAERARRELRASGEGTLPRVAAGWEALTAQEAQIALLAVQGLTNREIGNRLFLSHRTVSTHLYRIYPKLGVTTRAQLAAALGASEALPGGVVAPRPQGRQGRSQPYVT